MRRSISILFLFFVAFAGWWSCKKAYDPKIQSTGASYLVVEGFITTGTDSTRIRLTRSVPLTSYAGALPVTGATLTIVSDAGTSYPVFEDGGGNYASVPINSASPAKYSLKITTSDGKSYQSDFVEAKNSPPIDNLYYKTQDSPTQGLNIYADTHDPSGNSRYYRWDFVETYSFHSAFYSYDYHSIIPKDTVLIRPAANQIYQCWISDPSTTILVNTSAKLTDDIISQNLITFVPSYSEKLINRYSILVNQYVMTPAAYNYYQQLKKNTEQLGSIFDPQPSELPGNIHCLSNPSEAVIGFITAGIPSQKRIFIDNAQLPAWPIGNPYLGCVMDTDLYRKVAANGTVENQVAEFIYTGFHIPIAPDQPPGGPVIGYYSASPECTDCTLRGTNKRPDFWTDF